MDRYQCPPFFSARIVSGERVEEHATVENVSLHGLNLRTSCEFEHDSIAEIELRSTYIAPVKVHARVRWVAPAECEGSSHLIGFSIYKIRIVDWFRFTKLVAQLKKELW